MPRNRRASALVVAVVLVAASALSAAVGARPAAAVVVGPASGVVPTGCRSELPVPVTAPSATYGPTAFRPLGPVRLLDTRDGGPAGYLCPGATRTVPVAGRVGVPPSGAIAVVLNVTATDVGGAGFVTVWPAGLPRPDASSLNVTAPGQTRAGLVVVPIGDAGAVNVFAQSGAHVVIDVAGWFASASSAAEGRFVPVDPARLLDTRERSDRTAGARVSPGAPVLLPVLDRGGVPTAGVGAVVVNLTGVDAVAPGHVTAWPAGTTAPVVSNLNLAGPQEIAANLAVVPVGAGGRVALGVSVPVHLVVDVVGYLTDATAPVGDGGLFVPVAPQRAFDTRDPGLGRLAAGEVRTVAPLRVVALPASGVAAVAMTVTATDAGRGFVTVWPAGLPGGPPTVSSLNLDAADTRANAVWMRRGDGGGVAFLTQSGAQLLADVAGWFTTAGPAEPPPPPPDPDDALVASLVVSEPLTASFPAYDRDDWSTGWIDADRDGCDTRAEVLLATSTTPAVLAPGACRVVSGTWRDPLTGVTYTVATEVEIDHLVALADAHRSPAGGRGRPSGGGRSPTASTTVS
jgi:hypothetical protein